MMAVRGRQYYQPDTSWAWVVVAGLAMSNFIMGGFIKAFGIFFSAFADKFDSSASTTSVISGVRALMYIVFAPLGAILCERFSERTVLIGSSLLSFTGCIVTAFAQNIATVILGTGVLMGAGMSCFFGPVEITIGRHFDKRKSFAMSVAMAGMSLSQIVMPPLNVILMEEYSLKGTLLLYSGFLLNIMVAAALIRPAEARVQEAGVATEDVFLESKLTSNTYKDNPIPSEVGKAYLPQPNVQFAALNPQPNIYCQIDILKQEKQQVAEELPLNNVVDEKGGVVGDQKKRPKSISPKRFVDAVVTHFEFSLFKNAKFTCYLIAYCLSSVPFLNVPIYFFPRAEDYHLYPGQSALLLTVMGTAEFVAMILLGIMGDIKCLGPSFLFTWGVFCFGVSSACVILTKNFVEMAIVAAFLGLFNNSTSTLNMPILVDIVGLEKLPRALALISVIFGIVNALSPPLLGIVKDVTTSYDYVYVVFAVMLVLATTCMMAEKTVRYIRTRHTQTATPKCIMS